jgi:transposase
MQLSYVPPIWFYPQPIDFRKGVDGLTIIVASELELNPTSGQLFIFRNRAGNRLKLLWSDQHGFWLCYRRLEKGRFKLSLQTEATLELTRDELSWLLSGIDLTKQKSLPKFTAKHFY